MKTRCRKIVSLLLAGLMTLSLAGCGKQSAAKDVDYIKNKGTLVVGITDFAPMDYKDDDGNWIGFDADLAKRSAKI